MSKKKKSKSLSEFADATKAVGEKVEKGSRSFWSDFKKFAVKGNIIDLAVAVVIGAAFNKIVSSLVSCIITPLTNYLIPAGDISGLKWVIVPAVEANEEEGIAAVAEIAVKYGEFLQNAIDFLVITLSIYIVLRIFMRVKEAFNRKENEEKAEKKRIADEKKKAEADAAAEREERARREFVNDVAVQADMLTEIRDIMLRIEKVSSPKANPDN